MKTSKQYVVTVVSSGRPYDDGQLYKTIFDSLYSIKNMPVIVSPPLFTISRMVLLGRDIPLFGGLFYAPAKSTVANDILYPLLSNYAQMKYRKETIFIA